MKKLFFAVLLIHLLFLPGCGKGGDGDVNAGEQKSVGECKLSYGSQSEKYSILHFDVVCDDIELGGQTIKLREMVVVGPEESKVEHPDFEEPFEINSLQFVVRLPDETWKDGKFDMQPLRGKKLEVVPFDVEGDIGSLVVLPKTGKTMYDIEGGSFTFTSLSEGKESVGEYEEKITSWDCEAEVVLEAKGGKTISGTLKATASGIH